MRSPSRAGGNSGTGTSWWVTLISVGSTSSASPATAAVAAPKVTDSSLRLVKFRIGNNLTACGSGEVGPSGPHVHGYICLPHSIATCEPLCVLRSVGGAVACVREACIVLLAQRGSDRRAADSLVDVAGGGEAVRYPRSGIPSNMT